MHLKIFLKGWDKKKIYFIGKKAVTLEILNTSNKNRFKEKKVSHTGSKNVNSQKSIELKNSTDIHYFLIQFMRHWTLEA